MAFVQTSRPEPRSINYVSSKPKYTNNEPGFIIEKIMRRPPNKKCADCFAPNPNFINITLTTFLCEPCAGVHIKLQKKQSHDSIITVKYLPTTVLSQHEISRMQRINAGNEAVNATYLANYDFKKSSETHPHPDQHSDYELRKSWIIHKYIKRTWVINRKPKTLPDQALAIVSQITQLKNRLLREQSTLEPIRDRSPHSNSPNSSMIAHDLSSTVPQRFTVSSDSSGQFINPARDRADDSSVVSRRNTFIHNYRRPISDNTSIRHASVSSRRGNLTNGTMSPSIYKTNSAENGSIGPYSVSSRRPRSSSCDSMESGRSMTSRKSGVDNTNGFVSSSILQLTTHEVILELMSQPENKRCADCATRHPKFLNLSLKSFVCSLCAYVHQHELSHHVVEIETYTFTKNDINRMSGEDVGNAKLNAVYLSRYDPIKEVDSPPNASSSRSFRVSWMMRKYVVKTWCSERYLKAEEKKLKLRSPLADPRISSSHVSEKYGRNNEQSLPQKNVRWSTSTKKILEDQTSRINHRQNSNFRMRSNSPPLDETLQTAISRSSIMQKNISVESDSKHNRKMESNSNRPQPKSDPFKSSQIYTAIKVGHGAHQVAGSKHIEGTESPLQNNLVRTSKSNGHNKTYEWRQKLPINEPNEDAILGTSIEDNRALDANSYFNVYHSGQMHHLPLGDSHPIIPTRDTYDDMDSMPHDLDANCDDESRVERPVFKPIVIRNAYKLSNSFADKTKNVVRKRVWFSLPKDRDDTTCNDVQDPALSTFDVHTKKSYEQESQQEPQLLQPQPSARSILPSELQSLLPSELQSSLQKANQKLTNFINSKATHLSEVQSSLKHANRNLAQKLKPKRRPSLRRVRSAEDIMNFEEEEKFIEDLNEPVKQDLQSVKIDRVRRRNSIF